MTGKLDCVVIGGGIIGLAVARRLVIAGRDVMLLEAEQQIALHTSSRNSEVIHAGLYYPTGSLKAKLCVRGRDLMYEFCRERGIPCARLGKLIVAVSPADDDRLRQLQRKAEENGVSDLRWLSRDDVRSMEPAVECTAGFLSPSTGIVDSHAFMQALQADLEAAGGSVICRSRVIAATPDDGDFVLRIADDPPFEVRCNTVINAAGHWAQDVARSIDGLQRRFIPGRYFAKGQYYAYQGKSPFRRLVYPLPTKHGLGIHSTLDISGAARFGPNVEWVEGIDYGFDERSTPEVVRAIRAYFPGLEADRLIPSYAGIRPKLSGPGEPAQDFVIQGRDVHGMEGLINLYGIESPGLTSSLAIADHVYDLLIP